MAILIHHKHLGKGLNPGGLRHTPVCVFLEDSRADCLVILKQLGNPIKQTKNRKICSEDELVSTIETCQYRTQTALNDECV